MAEPLTANPAVDRLKTELQKYALAQAERLLTGAGRKLGESTVKLTDIAEGRSPGFAKLALDSGRKITEGKGPVRSALEAGASHLKDNVVETAKGLGGGKRKKGGGGRKPTVIVESVDVGVPVREAYDQWTQYQEFATFTKGVRSADSADDTTSDWKLKIFWSSRSWKARTTEQVPDARIVWTSEGAKGTTKGVVTFHALAENLTRVLLIIEYYPKGLFERTGNIWRAQGRRARLDLKNFARHISLRGEAQDGWRGEIRDGEVVVSHEDAVAEEERGEESDEESGGEDRTEDDAAYEDEAEEPEADAEDAEAEDEDELYEEPADDDADAEYADDEDVEAEDAEADADADADEDTDERKQREYAHAGNRGRR